MRILVFGINYFPEVTGIGKYTAEMCEWFAKKGISVDVITSMPYYPHWEIANSYKKKLWYKETINGVNVYRAPLYVPRNVTGVSRIIHEISFSLSSCVWWSKLFHKKYDVTITIYPPLVSLVIPLFFGLFKQRRKNLCHIQDLQVDAAKDLKIIKNKAFLQVLITLEKSFLKRYHRISTISKGMKKRIKLKGIQEDKITVLPNWVDIEALCPKPLKKDNILKKFGYEKGDKIILYAGNLGEKQGLEFLLKTAERAQEEGKNSLKFLIVGEGGIKKKLKEIAKNKNLQNVRFRGLVSNTDLPDLLNLANFHIVLQKKSTSDLLMPSKLTGILSCGGIPIIGADRESYLYKIAKEEGFGLLIEPENHNSLYLKIINNIDKDLSRVSANARKYALSNFKKDLILEDFRNYMIGMHE